MIRLFLSTLLLIPVTYASAAKLSVAVTLSDIEPIVRAVGGSQVSTFSVMPAGGDPHSFSVTADVIRRLKNTRLIVYADSDFFHFEEKLREDLPMLRSTDWSAYVGHGARLLNFPGIPKNHHGFWLDFGNAEAIARVVADTLVALGADEVVIASNRDLFISELKAAKATGMTLTEEAEFAGDTIVAAVAGVAYIAHNLGLHVGAFLLREGAGFVSGRDLQRISKKLSDETWRGVLCPVSMRESKPGKVSEQIADDAESSVMYVRFLSRAPGQGSYLSQAYYNAAVLRKIGENISVSIHIGVVASAVFLVLIVGLVLLPFIRGRKKIRELRRQLAAHTGVEERQQ
jgi:ABC-type Zn uptake system ZnuABC Zn-binding protein ZnuA